MAREQGHNPFNITSADIFKAFASNLPQYNASASRSSVNNPAIPPRNYDIFSNPSKNISTESAPIFGEDSHRSDLRSSRENISTVHSLQNSSSSGLRNVSNSSALEALQGYGAKAQSPVQSPHWKNWNKSDYDKSSPVNEIYGMKTSNVSEELSGFSRDMEKPSGTFQNLKHETSNDGCTPFIDHLKTVDEEDEFLYGDSSSLPEAPKPVVEDSSTVMSKVSMSKPDTVWSDDEDLCYETQGNSNKTASVWDMRNKKVESIKVSQNLQQKLSSLAREVESPHKIPKEEYHSPARKLDVLVSHERPEERNLKPVNPDKSSQITTGTKSMYHMAAELLKKKNTERKLMSSSNESEDIYSASKNVPENENKLPISRSSENVKVLKPTRKLPKAFLKKDLEGIKDYIQGSHQKRGPSLEKYGPDSKHARHVSPPRHHSPYESTRPRSPSAPYRHRSPGPPRRRSPSSEYIKHSSSHYPRHRSPNHERDREYYEHSYRHHERYRRHSRSPGRRSRDRSPGYYRYKARSPPRTRRSRERSKSPRPSRPQERSKSPARYSSKDTSSDKYRKDLHKSQKTPDRYSKRKVKEGSESSFCSLTFSSSYNSSDSSTESSDEKEKKPPKKIPKSDVNADGSVKPDIKRLDSDAPEKSDSSFLPDDLTKNLAEIFNQQNKSAQDSEGSDVFNSLNDDKLNNIVKMLQHNQLLTQFVEGMQQEKQHSSTLVSGAVASPQIPVASCPEISANSGAPMPYHFPTPMPHVPVSYLPPPVPGFPPPPVMATGGFPPPPIIPGVPSPAYDAFPQVDSSRSLKPKSVRPSTLRTITVSDSPTTTTTNVYSNIKSIPTVESSRELAKPSSPERSKELKANKSKRVSSPPNPVTGKSVEEKNAMLIEMFKKKKAERHMAQVHLNSAVSDIVEMRNLLDSTFGKKITGPEKFIYEKCKGILNNASDTVTNYTKHAKRVDEELSKFKSKLPTALQAEVSKIKVEQCLEEETQNEIYTCYDNGEHHCYMCNGNKYTSIKSILNHIQSPEHQAVASFKDSEWKKHFIKDDKKEQDDVKKCKLEVVKGIEFIKPISGFYCALCQETTLECESAEQHIKSHNHFVKYKDFIKKNPLYEKKCLFKRFIQICESSKKKAKQEVEKQKQKLTEQKKKETASEVRAKEIVEKEKNREMQYEELEEESEDVSAPDNVKSANIKVNLKDEKDKTKESKDSESKNSTKFIYIGKAPNFKKALAQKPKPWYKRESILSKVKDESEDVPILTNIASKVAEKNLEQEKLSKSKIHEKDQNISAIQVHLTATTALKDKDEGKSNLDAKSVKPSSEKSETSGKRKPGPKNKDSVTNQNIALSDINMPDLPSTQTTKDISDPVPMDIDNSQDTKSRANSEEEKDFYILGIKKDDFTPLVVPVPPPNYSNSINAQTYMPPTAGHDTIQPLKNLDFSVPPPSLVPYQNNPPMPMYNNTFPNSNSYSNTNNAYPNSGGAYSNLNNAYANPYQNNVQPMGTFSYPNTSAAPPMYSNCNAESPFSKPPPHLPPFRSPPVMSYPNPSNLPCVPQYSNQRMDNIQNRNLLPVPSVPTSPIGQTPVQINAATIERPSVSYDSSFAKKKPQNLITIVPTNNPSPLIGKESSGSDSKLTDTVTSNIVSKSKDSDTSKTKKLNSKQKDVEKTEFEDVKETEIENAEKNIPKKTVADFVDSCEKENMKEESEKGALGTVTTISKTKKESDKGALSTATTISKSSKKASASKNHTSEDTGPIIIKKEKPSVDDSQLELEDQKCVDSLIKKESVKEQECVNSSVKKESVKEQECMSSLVKKEPVENDNAEELPGITSSLDAAMNERADETSAEEKDDEFLILDAIEEESVEKENTNISKLVEEPMEIVSSSIAGSDCQENQPSEHSTSEAISLQCADTVSKESLKLEVAQVQSDNNTEKSISEAVKSHSDNEKAIPIDILEKEDLPKKDNEKAVPIDILEKKDLPKKDDFKQDSDTDEYENDA